MKIRLFICIILILTGCSNDTTENNTRENPIRVTGEIEFGKYAVSPPEGYWYYERDYPKSFEGPDTYYLLTFFKDRDTFKDKDSIKRNAQIIKSTLYNIQVSKRKYTDLKSYWKESKDQEIIYSDLSPEMDSKLAALKEWSCKQPQISGMYSIACITLKDQLISITAIGESEDQVLGDIDTFKNIVTSFKAVD